MLQNGSSKTFIERIPLYIDYLKSLDPNIQKNVSATKIASALGFNDVLVRKDLQIVAKSGKPKVGYDTKDLILKLGSFLGYDKIIETIVIGCGRLGEALLHYDGFTSRGVDVCCGFDIDDKKINPDLKKPIYPLSYLNEYCTTNHTKVAIITVPNDVAQTVCDMLIDAGIEKIWNLTHVRLDVPSNVIVKNEDLANNLAIFVNNTY